MKKKLLLLVVFALCITALCSCKLFNKNNGNGDSNGDSTAAKGTIYNESERAHIISNYKSTASPTSSYKWLEELASHILDVADYDPFIIEATGIADGHEIVIGDTDREITAKAKELLAARIRRETNALEYDLDGWDKFAGYAVYSDGNSVAVVWSDFQLEEAAIKYFAEKFVVADHLELEEGYIKTEVFKLEEFLAARAQDVESEQWAELKAQIPAAYADEIVKAFQSLYSLYDIDMVRWLANLYDPQIVIVDSQGNPVPEYNVEGQEVYGGGWYHSNSGRDNLGFLPDIENTYVALEFVGSTGMAELFDDNYVPALPDWLKAQVGLWFQNLQDPDTFFYHPQWPKDYINANGLQSRITRDRGSARTTLRKLGFEQLYPEAVATSNPGLPEKLNSSSAVVAASKVVATAGMLWQYESTENFEKYIAQLEAELASYNDPDAKAGRLYKYGNDFQSTTNYINANPEIRRMVIEFFEKYQNPDNGTWSDVLCYNTTNGIHKIGAVYNSIGAQMNYVDKMVESVIEIVGWTYEEQPINAATELYNAWSCIPYIYENVRKHDPNGEEKITEIKDRIFSSSADLIMIAREQIAGFRRPDGSYGYNRSGSCPTAQGAPVALAGYNEGDVNGNAIASLDVILFIMKALELDAYMPDIFGEYERMEFVHILNNLSPVIKQTEELGEDVLHTFEDIPEGELPQDYSTALDSGRNPIPDTYAKVTTIDGNRVLEVVAKHRGTDDNGRNYSLRAPIYMVKNGANMALVEFDLVVYSEGTKSGQSLIQFNVAGSGSPVIYPYFGVDSSGTVYLTTDKYVKIGDLGKLDEKISFRLEYFWNEGIYRVYANGIFVGSNTATYNNRAHMEVQSITLGAPSTATVHYSLDNVRMLRTVKEYVDESLATSPDHSFKGEDGTPVKGFIENGVLVIPYDGSANYAGEGETIELHGSGSGPALNVTIPTFTREGLLPNATDLSLDFKVSSLRNGSMKLAILDKAGSVITGLGFAESDDGTKIIGSHYSSDLLTSFCNFYMADNLEGKDDITLNLNYTYETGIMKVSIGDAEYTAITGTIEGLSGIKIFLEGAETLIELDEAHLENVYEEIPDNVEVKVDPNYEDFEKGYTEKCEEWVCNHSSHTGSPEQTVTNLYFPTGVNAVFNAESGYSNTHGAVAQVLADAVTGNKYVNIVAPKRISARDRAHNYVINAQNCVLDPNVFVIETDIKFDSVLPDGTATHSTYLQITLTNEVTNKYVMFMMSNNPAQVTLGGVELADWDEWFKLKIEYYPTEGVIQLYANGAYKGELKEGYGASSSSDKSFATLGDRITKVSFSGANSTSAGFSINFDNSALYSAKGEYVGGREPEIVYPDGPDYETFDKVAETDGIGNTLTGKTGTSVAYSAKTNDGGAKAFLRTDEAIANNFVTIYSSGRATSTDRSHGVSVPITTLCGDPNVLVLEASLRLNSKSTSTDYIQISFSHKPDANHFYYGQLNMSVKDGIASFGGVKVGYVDEWFELKFEFYITDGKMKVYNGDLFLGEITTFSQASTEAKLVSELTEVSAVSINSYNGNGMFLFNIDNIAAYRTNITYTVETASELPAASPDVDDFDPTAEDDSGDGGTTDPVVPDTPEGGGTVDSDPIDPGVDTPEIDVPDDGSFGDDDIGEWT